MSQKARAVATPSKPLPEHLITGDRADGDERLIGGDTGLAAVMVRAHMVVAERRAGAAVRRDRHRQGDHRPRDPRALDVPRRSVPPGELRRHRAGADRLRAVRPRAGRVHRRLARRRKGWFEQANGGTLFLDEVGELALPAQVRLLRVVQDGEVVRVGGERPVRVNVRIVAATHRDLPAMVEAQTFREDLYYRLAVFPIVIPPLRDRPSDIRAFAEYFAERAANRFGLRPVPVSDEDVRVLTDYRWPGNVREIAAVMDRAVLIGQGRALSVTAALGLSTRPVTCLTRGPGALRRRRHRAAGRGDPPPHRGGADRDARSGRRTVRRGATAARSTRIRCARGCAS